MQHKRLESWIGHINTLHPDAIHMGLERIGRVAQNLELDKNRLGFVITVGGTNGKGSTVALLESCLRAAGKRVGSYTSPHLQVFNERVSINGAMVSDQALCAAFEQVEQARRAEALTFFEFTTLAALWLFQQADLDYTLLEVGLGGRLDAVNIIDPDLCAIVSIDHDHSEYLGDTLEAIAFEKCGIFRPGINAVYGGDAVLETLRGRARAIGTRLLDQSDYSFEVHEQAWSWRGVGAAFSHLPLPPIVLSNAALCLQLLQLCPDDIDREAVVLGLESVSIPGRMQRLERNGRSFLLDVGHNPHAVRYLREQISAMDFKRVIGVFGVMRDKDYRRMIEILSGTVTHWIVAQPEGERALPAEALVEEIKQQGGVVLGVYSDIKDLCRELLSAGEAGDLLVVFGSFWVVGPVLERIAS